jgi:hypothetical protein
MNKPIYFSRPNIKKFLKIKLTITSYALPPEEGAAVVLEPLVGFFD